MENLVDPALTHVKKLLTDPVIPPLKGEVAGIPLLREIHAEVCSIRKVLDTLASRDLKPPLVLPEDCPESLAVFLSRVGATLQEYQKKEDALFALTENLRSEMNNRNSTMAALQKSEARFRYLADHDPLTGAMNRRSFMDRAIEELNDAGRHQISCGIIMMDLDRFKLFNDTHGHLAGDEALRHTVQVIESFSRKHDFLGRYGGEEFIFFFSHADKPTSLVIAERIRKGLETQPVLLENQAVPLTASLGVALAEFPKNPDFTRLSDYLELLIKKADSAMYRAKKAGRNQVVLFEGNFENEERGLPEPLDTALSGVPLEI